MTSGTAPSGLTMGRIASTAAADVAEVSVNQFMCAL